MSPDKKHALNIAVIGAGPLGACSAHALANKLDKLAIPGVIHLIDANNPLESDLNRLSASGPNAAGQLILHAFDAGSYAKSLARRTHEALHAIEDAGYIRLHPRRWIICAGNADTPLDNAAREVLYAAHREGRLEGCELLDANKLENIPGLRKDQLAFAVVDETAKAVNPPQFVRGLARWACAHKRVRPHFGNTVVGLDADNLSVQNSEGVAEMKIDAAVLCTGIHAEFCKGLLPKLRPEYLHVADHQHGGHIPKILDLIVGETTIARYPGFGPTRGAITPHLSDPIREMGIHGLLTDVPGLRRMLDSHFADKALAESKSEEVFGALRELIGRYVEPSCLLGAPESEKNTTHACVAAYAKLLDGDGPYIETLDAPLPMVYAQPSNGLGLNQCVAIGEDAAERLFTCLA